DYGMDVQSAIDAPRAFFERDLTLVERGMPAATVEGLRARGHEVMAAPSPWGGAQAIRIDWRRGVLIGGSEPRKDGCALGYQRASSIQSATKMRQRDGPGAPCSW